MNEYTLGSVSEMVNANRKMSETDILQIPNLSNNYHNIYEPLDYLTNYISVLNTTYDKYNGPRLRQENELQLIKYYESKKPTSISSLRHNSIVSSTDSTAVQSEKFRMNNLFVDKFLACRVNKIDSHQFESSSGSFRYSRARSHRLNYMGYDGSKDRRDDTPIDAIDSDLDDDNIDWTATHDIDNFLVSERSDFANSFFKYYKKLLTVDIKDLGILEKYNLWIPTIRRKCKILLTYAKENDFEKMTCPLFVKGIDYLPKSYDPFSGSCVVPSLFSEYKMPALTYHCSFEFNKDIYVFGGLMASNRYDDEAPNLSRFHVDGIKNLPPPLLPSVVNNPIMIDNPHLYVISVGSSRLSRPELSGQIPPPLLCATASKLSDRYILFYGGFEIKTETHFDISGDYYLKRRAFLNNTVYILDTVSFRFTKLEVNAQPYQFVKYPNFAPRFGHMQISVNNIAELPSGRSSECSRSDASIDAIGSSSDICSDISQQATPEMAQPKSRADSSLTGGGINVKMGNSAFPHSTSLYTTIIFGGYRQTGDDKYEAMNDMWKLDVKVVARGKKGYLNFADSVTATKIPITKDNNENWPSSRAFFAYSVPEASLTHETSLETRLLERLKLHFEESQKETDKDVKTSQESKSTMPIFPNIPHNRNEKANVIGSHPMVRQYSVNQHQYTASPKTDKNNTDYFDQDKYDTSRKIVLHGGSDDTNVYGDMWWFDLETFQWTKVATYIKPKDQDSSLVPINIKIVGHTMMTSGCMAVCVGGITQAEVNLAYDNPSDGEESHYNDYMGGSLINMFDLTTQCLQDCSIEMQAEQSGKTHIHRSDPDSRAHLITTFGGTALQYDGTVILVGGLAAERQFMEKFYLRGALLEFILPPMSLSE
ncbi:hypothetical protein KAFR_0C04910 [Kazachstania africana CBS 2517]|uniref:Uncharacterized protein n=1 Tax=Kazachstania africana (strain ATCC 22294 / BCRC 22015 / CBS 2517 / CECT 1963 / NBRC 1671 / NRRL Y-8276) TaxID=1071382 RepID=H2ASY2_KAZAF|nr:hypothetical protein KAFR_0C04910 [Kazachstania africana CBS 2517]CCF57482.1 hypothetical protein KAFR_0C04910 [Kazachstania africana CBS 2517]